MNIRNCWEKCNGYFLRVRPLRIHLPVKMEMVTGGTMTMRTMEMTEITEITEITAEVEIKAEMESMAKTETVVEVDTTVERKA